MQLCDLSVQSLGIGKKQLSSPCPEGHLLKCSYVIRQYQRRRVYRLAARLLMPKMQAEGPALSKIFGQDKTFHVAFEHFCYEVIVWKEMWKQVINRIVITPFRSHLLYCITNYIRISVFTKKDGT